MGCEVGYQCMKLQIAARFFANTTCLSVWLLTWQTGLAQVHADDQCLETLGAQVWVNGADFLMGDDRFYAEEGPVHRVSVDGFWIDVHEVTNAQFRKFIEATGYITVAERTPTTRDWMNDVPAEQLIPGSVVFTPERTALESGYWWTWTAGANWRHPHGPESDIQGKDHFPVVHVAYEDAEAYAKWIGRSLPTEAQFELAARSRRNTVFPWGSNELAPHGQHRANTWQGAFPVEDTAQDGYRGLAPVGCFAANDYGAHDLIGNVWEWTLNLYSAHHNPADINNPQGPLVQSPTGVAAASVVERVIKGGSYLCAENYCLRFRPAAREAQDTGFGTSHIGFRTVAN